MLLFTEVGFLLFEEFAFIEMSIPQKQRNIVPREYYSFHSISHTNHNYELLTFYFSLLFDIMFFEVLVRFWTFFLQHKKICAQISNALNFNLELSFFFLSSKSRNIKECKNPHK